MARSRGSTREAAQRYRSEGHDAATLFALLIGMDKDYRNDPHAKKDVIDPSGDAHSVKAGQKKWQIFLYGRNRFITDDGFQALNGIGQLLIHCIDAFPPRYEDYEESKDAAKEQLKVPMRDLKDRFQRKALLRAFLGKSIFNGGEVDYLTVLDDGKFHVFRSKDVVQTMGEVFDVVNSKARSEGQHDDQKVLFRVDGKNVGELEMRNDGPPHYREVRFNMNKDPCMDLLRANISKREPFNDDVLMYGTAIRTFGNWE